MKHSRKNTIKEKYKGKLAINIKNKLASEHTYLGLVDQLAQENAKQHLNKDGGVNACLFIPA